jgi:hypothetical protein
MNRFEQLIEYVINDEEAKARELFHDIVVEKSRQIYEDIMAEEAEEDIEEAKHEEMDEAEEELDEGMMGGDAADDLIDDVEMEEESDMNMEAEGDEEMDMSMDDDGEEAEFSMSDEGGSSEAATKDDIMNLEDKLDQLMAEFEDLMGGDDMGDGDGFGPDEGGDAIEMDDTDEMEPGMMEAVSLKAAPKPVTSEEGGVNKKSTYAANSGQAGMASRPVHTGANEGGRHDASGAYSNNTKDLIGKVGNTPAQGTQKPSAAPKPKMGAGSEGQNNKSPLPGGRKG